MTSDPFLLDINAARMINTLSGGAVIGPWDVGLLSDDELDAFRALGVDLPMRQQEETIKQQNFEDARRRHPNYRRYNVQ